MIESRMICCVYFMWIMPSAVQSPNVLIRHIGNHVQEFWIFAKKVGSCICSSFCFESLIFSINGFIHAFAQKTFCISRQQWIPVGTPNHFYNIPPCTPETTFKLLNNFSISTHWSIKSLQIAVYNKYQII